MKSIIKREKELFNETWRLKEAGFQVTQNKKGTKQDKFKRSMEIRRQEEELYKKQQFFKKYIREMEKLNK